MLKSYHGLWARSWMVYFRLHRHISRSAAVSTHRLTYRHASSASSSTKVPESKRNRPELFEDHVRAVLAGPSRPFNSLRRWFNAIKGKLGFRTLIDSDLMQLLDRSSAQLYYSCANYYPYLKLCESFGLPDHFSTWFNLTLMHVWMVLLRVHVSLSSQEYLRFQRSILSAFWIDVDKRLEIVKKETKQRLTLKKDIRNLHGLHLQTLFEYDEGFLSDDTVLAGAVWRCLYLGERCDPIHVNRVVHYMRSTVAYLDTLDITDILAHGINEWRTAKPRAYSVGNDAKT